METKTTKASPLLAMWTVTPNVAVGVDQSLCIVLVTAEDKGPRWTITNVDGMKAALDRAREYVAVYESVMTDWKDDPEKGLEIVRQAAGTD
jgi:hypothetical protein